MRLLACMISISNLHPTTYATVLTHQKIKSNLCTECLSDCVCLSVGSEVSDSILYVCTYLQSSSSTVVARISIGATKKEQ